MLSKTAAYDVARALYTWPYDADDEMTELRLVPENPAQLDAMFKALCECAAMNPDDDEDGEEDGMGEAGDFYYDEEVRLCMIRAISYQVPPYDIHHIFRPSFLESSAAL